MPHRIEIITADITTLSLDAIVNAANTTLLGGGGVDGAIHRVAGPRLRLECQQLGGCEVGEAKLTRGYGLPARQVIHTVGPIWRGGEQGEDEALHNAYVSALQLAKRHGLASIAFPAISAGAYGFPMDRAAWIAVETVADVIEDDPHWQRVVFCCFKDADQSHYRDAMEQLGLKSAEP